ncbi:HET-domain-containing protein, partial [Zopfia rhizophila CBS 207.26]
FKPSAEVKRSADQIVTWLKTCIQTHTYSSCFSTLSAAQPRRLIHLPSNSAVARLIDIPNCPAPHYVALSYCWGLVSDNLQTTAQKLQVMKEGITDRKLPLTLKHVFDLTRALGVEYLWIDALCIIQDDKEDWATESQKMGPIYSDAYLTLSATSS